MSKKVSFEGIGQVCASFHADGKIVAGDVVKLSDSGTVAATADGDAPFGVACTDARDGFVTVQVYGLAAVPCADATVTAGRVSLKADGNGGVKKAQGGTEYLVVACDTGAVTIKL